MFHCSCVCVCAQLQSGNWPLPFQRPAADDLSLATRDKINLRIVLADVTSPRALHGFTTANDPGAGDVHRRIAGRIAQLLIRSLLLLIH